MNAKNKTPKEPKAWIQDISYAYLDAYETIPFAKLTGTELTKETLFHLSPEVCLKFRGIKRNKSNVKLATDAAFSSYVATKENTPELFESSEMSFAFCYIASHFGLNLLDEEACSSTLEYVEENLDLLIKTIKQISENTA